MRLVSPIRRCQHHFLQEEKKIALKEFLDNLRQKVTIHQMNLFLTIVKIFFTKFFFLGMHL